MMEKHSFDFSRVGTNAFRITGQAGAFTLSRESSDGWSVAVRMMIVGGSAIAVASASAIVVLLMQPTHEEYYFVGIALLVICGAVALDSAKPVRYRWELTAGGSSASIVSSGRDECIAAWGAGEEVRIRRRFAVAAERSRWLLVEEGAKRDVWARSRKVDDAVRVTVAGAEGEERVESSLLVACAHFLGLGAAA